MSLDMHLPEGSARMVSVVVVSFHSEHVLSACLSSVQSQLPGAEVIVVDNATGARVADLVASILPAAKTLSGHGNIGFGAGCNLGVRACTRQAILFLNPDAVVESVDHELLCKSFAVGPMGLVAPLFREHDGSLRHAVFRFRGTTREFAKHTIGPLLPRGVSSHLGHVRAEGQGWVSGAALLVDRVEFIAAGGFDERYFLYYEDQDLSRRYLARGLPVRRTEGMVVGHDAGLGSSADGASSVALSSAWLSWLQYVALWDGERRAATLARRSGWLRVLVSTLASAAASVVRQSGSLAAKARLLSASAQNVSEWAALSTSSAIPLASYPDSRSAFSHALSVTISVGDLALRAQSRLARPGIDPFDALRSPILRKLAGTSPRRRQIVVQLRKRGFLPASRVLGIEPFRMAKTLSCRLIAQARLCAAGMAQPDDVISAARDLLGDPSIARHDDGGWGYEFDVQTRWAFYPRGSSNVIATIFATRALSEAGCVLGDNGLIEEAAASAHHILEHLRSGGTEEAEFFLYAPTSATLIHNANLLAAGVVAGVGRIAAEDSWVDIARRCADASLSRLDKNGVWPYGEGPGLGWVDNFHTAYSLDGLMLLWLATGEEDLRHILDLSTHAWTSRFFGRLGEPRYFADKPRPYDIHSAATAVDVAARLETWGLSTHGLPERTTDWTRRHLCDPLTGETRYRSGAGLGARRHFLRWGEAHWALALSSLLLRDAGHVSPMEAFVADKTGVKR